MQKWYGYQEYYQHGNVYITSGSYKSYISIAVTQTDVFENI